jgi:hypothetical protein
MQFVEWENLFAAHTPANVIDTHGSKRSDATLAVRAGTDDSAAS